MSRTKEKMSGIELLQLLQDKQTEIEKEGRNAGHYMSFALSVNSKLMEWAEDRFKDFDMDKKMDMGFWYANFEDLDLYI